MRTMARRLLCAGFLAAGVAQAPAQTNFFWTNPLDGAWSGANWTNAQVTPATPPAGGAADYVLGFHQAAAFTANNDLAGAFFLNGLQFGAGTATLTGNALVLTNRGAVAPLVTNWSGGAATVGNSVEFGAHGVLGAAAGSTLVMGGVLGGIGNVTNTGTGAIVLTGNNTYSGATVVRASGSGLWQGVVLSNTTGGVAIPGHVYLGAVSGSAYLRLGADEQIANTGVVNFVGGNHGRLILLGHTETVRGLASASGNGVAENTDGSEGSSGFGPATLILEPGVGETYSFGGFLRNAFTGGASNTLALVKNGAGTQILLGGNITFSAGATVNAGALLLSNTTAFGSAVTVNGGQLQLASSVAMNGKSITNNVASGVAFLNPTAYTVGGLGGGGALTLTNIAGAAVTLSVGGGNASGTYGGDLDGPGALTKTGTGTQVVSGNNTYAGATTVEQGVLTATKAAALPGYNSAGMVVVKTGTIAVRTGGVGEWSGAEIDALLANATWNAGSMLGIDVTSGSIGLAGDTAGTQGFHKLGAGTLTLSGNNSYAGGTTISEGILSVASTANLPTSGGLNVTGGTLRVTGTSLANLDAYTLNAAGFRGGIDVDDASHSLTISQGISGNGWLTKEGAGTLILSGINTFTGGVTNNAGTLRLGGASAWAATNPLRLLGGDVDLGGYTVAMASLAGAAGTTITNNGGLTVNQGVEGTFSGAIVGTGGFTKAGGSTLVLAGANTYSGLTVVNNSAGTLVLSNTAGNAIAGDLQLGNGTGGAVYLRLGADEQMPDTAVLHFSGTGPNSRYTLLGFDETLGGLSDPSGFGIVENNDSYKTAFTNAGPSTLTLNVAAASNLAFSGYLRNYHGDGAGPSNTLTVIKTGAGSQILSGANIGNGGLAGLVVQGGDLVLTNTASLPTGVLVDGGRLVLASQTAINNRAITNNVAGGVAFRHGTAFSVGGLFGAGGITLTNETGSAVALTIGNGNTAGDFAGAFDGPGSVIKGGTAVFTLSGASSYAGLTTVNGGTLLVAHNSALGSTAAGTLVDEGGQIMLADGVTVTGEDLTVAGGGNNMGALQAAAGATGTWAGTLTLGDFDDGDWRPRLGAAPGGTLVVSGDIVDGVGTSLYISGQSGTGRVVVSGTNNTYSGRTGIVRGILAIGRDETLPAGAQLDMNAAAVADPSVFDLNGYDQTVAGLRTISTSAQSTVTNSSASPSRLIVNQAPTSTYAGVIGGNLSLVKSGAGTLILSGDSSYQGTTSVSGGVLRVNGSHTGGGLITVYGGGVLGGTGSVGSVSVQAGGVLGAGNSVGTMTFTDNVEILGALEVENVGAEVDRLSITGSLTLGAGSLLDLVGTLDGSSSYTIITFSGTRTGTFGDVSDVTAQGYQVDYNPNDVTLTVIPEPATLGLLGVVAAAVLLRRRLRGYAS